VNIETPTLADYIRSMLLRAGFPEHDPDREQKGFVIVPGRRSTRAASVSVGWTGTPGDPSTLLLAQYANALGQFDVADWGNFLIVTRKADQ